VEGDDPHPGAVVWATSSGLPFDQDDAVRALNARLKIGKGDASHAVAVAFLTATRGAKDRALSGLRRNRKLFSDDADIKLIDYWIGLLSSKGGDGSTQKFNEALGKLRKSGDADDLMTMLDSGGLDADMELAAYENMAINGKWLEINDRRASLLAFQTSHASEVAIRAAFALNLHRDVIALAAEQAGTFHASRLPTVLGILVAKSQLWEGDASLALRALGEMRAGDSSNELAFEDAMMRLRIGDLSGAAAVIRGRQVPGHSPEALLKIAAELRFEDPELARGLLEGISFVDLNNRLLPDALALVNQLGLQAAANAIMPRLFGPDAEPSGIVVINSVEEAIQFVRDDADRRRKADADRTEKWLKGEIPSHLVFDGSPAEMAWFFHRPFMVPPKLREDGELEGKPFLLRSGIRRMDNGSSELLVLDATALLVGHELGLLEHLEHAWARILLPSETPELLRSMEQELEQQFGHVADEARDIRRRLEVGRFALSGSTGSVTRLVISSDGEEDPSSVTLAALLAHLVDGGMDGELARKALAQLSIAAFEGDAALSSVLEFTTTPGDLVTLLRVGLLDRLSEDVVLIVEAPVRTQWLAGFDHHLDGRALADKTKELRQLVARKADAGTWHFLPVDRSEREGLQNSGAASHLFLSLIKAAERQKCEIWSEDRMLSLVGKPGNAVIIDTAAVLDRLSRRMAESQRNEARKRLRTAGYGFVLPSAGDIADALLAAPVKRNELVETDELAAIRRDFAIQFANSRHLVDKSGGVAPGEPEMLFMSRLLGLTGKVFAALWNRSNVGDARLNAAASWASRHLRVEQAKFLPRENRTVAGREGLLYLQHLSVVGAMFNITGKSFRQARERRSRFLNWVLGNIVEPAMEIHPAFRARLVDYIAGALASLGKLDRNHPDVTQEMLTGVILDYLNAFPEDWRHDLQRHALLADLVGLREIEVVGIGEDFSFEAEKFYAAIAEARSTGRSVVQARDGGRNAVITLILDAVPAPDKPAAFMVKAGSKTENFSDDRLELETTDVDERLRALKRHPEWFDLTGSEFDIVAGDIAQNPDSKTRRRLLSDAQAMAMSWRLRTLEGQIGKKGSSDKELLLPPRPESVRRYLRLSSPVDFADMMWLHHAFRRLQDEMGPLSALARIGGIPFELDEEVRTAVLDAVRDAGLEKALRLVGPTPLVRTALSSILLSDGSHQLDLSELTKPWSDYGVLFHALLRLAFNSAARRDEWKQVPEPERSILLWAHANAVLGVLQRQDAAPKETAKIIDGFLKQRVDDVHRRSISPSGRLADPFASSWRLTASVAIAYAIRDRATVELNAIQLGQLRKAVARQVGEDWLLELEAWVPSTASEPPGCWLSVDPALPLTAAGVAALPTPIDERDPQAMALLLVQRIVDEAIGEETSAYWPLLWLLGAEVLDDDTRARVKAVVGRADRLPELSAQNGGVWGGALRYRAKLYARDNDIASFRRMLIAGAEQVRSHYLGEKVSDLSLESPVVATFHRLTESIWQYSSASSSDLNQCALRFAELVVVLAGAWPSSLLGCLTLLDVIAAQLETEPAGPLWDAINLVRSR